MTHNADHPGAGGIMGVSRFMTPEQHKELLGEAAKNLRLKNRGQGVVPSQEIPVHSNIPFRVVKSMLKEYQSIEKLMGKKPQGWTKPNYASFEYHLAHQKGWISQQEVGRDRKIYEERSNRSLKSCHRYSKKWFALPDNPTIPSGGSFTPETSSAILDDPGLCDGERRFALKLMEVVYKRDRKGRELETTVSYLAKMLGRHRRTIQNYLSKLEYKGYIKVNVVFSKLTKMSIGLVIKLGTALFPKHHKEKWPEKRSNPGVQLDSFKIVHINNTELIPRNSWALRCMEGVFRAFFANNYHSAPPI